MFYNLIIQNKELIKIFYALIISIICLVIVLKTDRLFRLSLHTGIRYLRNAFLFFGLGFMTRYSSGYLPKYSIITTFLFEYFFIMAGFFLLYSLLWKKIEGPKSHYHSSLFNAKILLFYIMTFVIASLDYLWQTHYLMFYSQIILFTFTAVISGINYRKNGSRHRFLKFYFIAMVLSLVAWLLNALAALSLNWHPGILIIIYFLNIIIFLLFLYGVIKVTKK